MQIPNYIQLYVRNAISTGTRSRTQHMYTSQVFESTNGTVELSDENREDRSGAFGRWRRGCPRSGDREAAKTNRSFAMESEDAPDAPSIPEQPDSVAAPSGSVEEATPTDKGILETQENVPQPGKKPSRPPPAKPNRPLGRDSGDGSGNGGGGSGSGSKSSKSKQPSVPGRRPPSRPAPTPTPLVAPAAPLLPKPRT